MISYKPRRHIYNFGQKKTSINFTRSISHKRILLNDLYKLMAIIWFYWFLTFTGKIGPIFPMIATDFNLFMIYQQSDNIEIPQAQFQSKITISSRHLLNISIHRDGVIVVDGRKCNDEDIYPIVRNKIICDPQVRAFFIVDKNCKMEYIKKVYKILQEVQIFKVYHMVSNSGKKVI